MELLITLACVALVVFIATTLISLGVMLWTAFKS